MKTTYHKIFGKPEFLKKLILLIPLFLIFTCNEDMVIVRPATLSTSDITDIGPTTATVGGNITSNGGAAVTDRGVYWGTSSDPEITGSKLEMGSGMGSFSDSLTGLIADTKYYVKAYAHNGGRPTYGDEKFFLTISDSTNLDITMQNSNGSTGPYPSSNGEVHLYKKGVLVAFDKTDNFGLAQFKNLEAGKDYEARFYHDADITAPHGSEYWGRKIITIPAGQATTTTFTRYMPYIASSYYYSYPEKAIKVYANNEDVTGTDVAINTELIIRVSVRNVGGALQGKSRLILDKEKDSSYDFDVISTNQTLSGDTSITQFSFTYSPSDPGDYYYTINIQTEATELGGYVVTDTREWSTNELFDVLFTMGDQGTMTDSRDGNTYNTITIGNQEWFAENLAYLPDINPGRSITEPFYFVYGYRGYDVSEAIATENYQTYGVLYNWNAAMDGALSNSDNPSGVQGACPSGWHIPSDAEWSELTDFLGGEKEAGARLKEAGNSHWNADNWPGPSPGGWSEEATDEVGFTALPGGLLFFTSSGHHFDFAAIDGYWWTATEINTTEAWYRGMFINSDEVHRFKSSKIDGLSVRCLKDD